MRKEDTILVIDMQKVYLPGNPWACAYVNAAAQQIETLLDENPVMNEFIPAIARYVEEFPYIDKCTYSCFSNEYVRVAADRSMVHGGRIVLTGVVAECCVLATFFEGTDAGYRFVYLTDACAGVDDESERAVQTILQGLSPLHVELMTTAEYIAER